MAQAVFVDTCTLGVLSNPNESEDVKACREWAIHLHRRGVLVRIPEIADYELRRELIRANKGMGIAELDEMISIFGLVPICTDAMRCAAQFWANLRIGMGNKGTDDRRLDADVILSAQAYVFAQQEDVEVHIATDNVRHFQPLVDMTYIVSAEAWDMLSILDGSSDDTH